MTTSEESRKIHKRWLHERGYMTHSEALWYHRIVGAVTILALCVVLLFLLPLAVHLIAPLVRWYLGLF